MLAFPDGRAHIPCSNSPDAALGLCGTAHRIRTRSVVSFRALQQGAPRPCGVGALQAAFAPSRAFAMKVGLPSLRLSCIEVNLLQCAGVYVGWAPVWNALAARMRLIEGHVDSGRDGHVSRAVPHEPLGMVMPSVRAQDCLSMTHARHVISGRNYDSYL